MSTTVAIKLGMLLKDEKIRKKIIEILLVFIFLFTGLGGSINVQNMEANIEEAGQLLSSYIAEKQVVLGITQKTDIRLVRTILAYIINEYSMVLGTSSNVAQKMANAIYPDPTFEEVASPELYKIPTTYEEIFTAVENAFQMRFNSHTKEILIEYSRKLPETDTTDRSFLTYNLSTAEGKTNIGLCNFVYNVVQQGCGYVYGAFGQDITMAYLRQQQITFAGDSSANLTTEQVYYIYNTFAGKPAFDCIGLMKAYEWLDESTGNINYASNGFSDLGANGTYKAAQVKGTIGSIAEIPGLAVWMDGHIGVYVGQGNVIEAQGNQVGVIMTKLAERPWTHWLQLPGLTYVTSGNYRIDKYIVTIQSGRAVSWTEGTTAGKGGFLWPLPAPYGTDYITSTFGGRQNPITGHWENAHGAIDIGVPGGTPIYAAADGTVVMARWDDSYGNFVKIKHNDTYSTLYAHSSKLLVREGQSVKQGDTIALVGTTGDSTGNHLHFEIRVNNERVDPMGYF